MKRAKNIKTVTNQAAFETSDPLTPENDELLVQRATTGPKTVPLPHEYQPVSSALADNEAFLRRVFQNTTDIVFREFYMGEIQCMAVWIDGLAMNRISHDMFRSLMFEAPVEKIYDVPASQRADYTIKHLLPFYAALQVTDLIEAKRWVLMHKMVLIIDGCPVVIVLDTEATPMRGITEPTMESVVAGPRDSFVESLRINTALIRARLGDSALKSENYIIGRRSNTLVTLMYVEDLARPEVLQEVRRRLARIDIDGMLDSSLLRELIRDSGLSVVPMMKGTERPDKVCADLLEGRFALIVNGSPIVLTAPSIFVEFMQSAEDYYHPVLVADFVRLMRYMGLVVAVGATGLYVAITTFHQEMIPIPLIFGIAGTRESVPFPGLLEALSMLIVFELLWEAGIRLPKVIGGAVSIVGALILGQAAVQAGFVSPALVIIIALTAISNFSLGSAYDLASGVRLARLFVLFAGGTMGLYGITLSFLVISIYLTSLRSFGVPYLAPLSMISEAGGQDTLLRNPRWSMKRRPDYIAGKDIIRSQMNEPRAPVGQGISDGADSNAGKELK